MAFVSHQKNRDKVEDRISKYSRDEWKANRRIEKEIKLPPLQADTISAINMKDNREPMNKSSNRNGSERYIETPRINMELKPRRIIRNQGGYRETPRRTKSLRCRKIFRELGSSIED